MVNRSGNDDRNELTPSCTSYHTNEGPGYVKLSGTGRFMDNVCNGRVKIFSKIRKALRKSPVQPWLTIMPLVNFTKIYQSSKSEILAFTGTDNLNDDILRFVLIRVLNFWINYFLKFESFDVKVDILRHVSIETGAECCCRIRIALRFSEVVWKRLRHTIRLEKTSPLYFSHLYQI